LESLQSKIDAIAYPPTHTYELDGLVPTGVLGSRMRVILPMAKEFFSVRNFLDVGCNKGFFSMYAANRSGQVVAIDPVCEYADLCREIAPENCRVLNKSFGEFDHPGKFDSIFVGNGPHYLYREAGGWSFVRKLAQLCRGQVLLEGPTGMECRDMIAAIPKELRGSFNRESQDEAFAESGFKLLDRRPSFGYTPDRYLSLHQIQQDELMTAPMERYGEYLQQVYKRMADFIDGGRVMEICTRHDRGVLSPPLIPHSKFILVDATRNRPGLTLDAVSDELPECDVVISTAILHHTPETWIPALLRNLARTGASKMIFTGPSAEIEPEVYGDHRYHLEIEGLTKHAESCGFSVFSEPIGLTEPYCELLVCMVKK